MPLHALAATKPSPPSALLAPYAFDAALSGGERDLLARFLDDLIRLGLLPGMAQCCAFSAELVANLLRRNGVAAQTIPCRLTIRTPAGYAVLGEGFARTGQIDSHVVTLTETLLIDWALGAARALPRLASLPLGISIGRHRDNVHLGESRVNDMHLLWERTSPGADTMRHLAAEKMKAARIFHQANLKRGRLR